MTNADQIAVAKVQEPQHKEFARRFAAAIDGHPNVPAVNYGRLGWFVAELAKRGVEVKAETVRKWMAGFTLPRHKAMKALAQALQVDEGWLSIGQDVEYDSSERRVHSRLASSATNIIAGFIQADGGHPAFPQEDDAVAASKHVDLYAVIRGINYSFHITIPLGEGEHTHFAVPVDARGSVVLALVTIGRFSFKVLELDWDALDSVGVRKGGTIVVPMNAHQWREIESFSQRL
jgi:transcriptional regulator with XRE-family HTH domain